MPTPPDACGVVDPVDAVDPDPVEPPGVGVDAAAVEALANAPTARPATISVGTRNWSGLSFAGLRG
jgi:hypothetical protein